MERTSKEGKTVEQEPIPLKTGLELIKLAVGEDPVEWFELKHMSDAYDADLVLKMVGKNGLVGSFRCRSALIFSEMEDWSAPLPYLEGIGRKIGFIKEGEGGYSLAKRVKDVSGEKQTLLVLKGEVPFRPDDDKQFFYEVPSEALVPLVEELDREVLTLRFSEVMSRVRYRLDGGLFSCHFPEVGQPLYYNIMRRVPLSEEIIKVGEGEALMRFLFEPALALDKFLREHQGEFEKLFAAWQEQT